MAVERLGYHGKILSIRREDDHIDQIHKTSDHKIITVQPEGKQPSKKYRVMDIFFSTTDDKIIEKLVFIKEDSSGELMKILLDVSKQPKEEIEQNPKDKISKIPKDKYINPVVLFRYDQDTFNTYRRVSLGPIKNTLHETLKKTLNLRENKSHIKDIIYGMPSYISQYGYFEKYITKFNDNTDADLSIYESEDIHFFYSAYIGAKLMLDTKTEKDSIKEQEILEKMYFNYEDKVINKDLAISLHIFSGYVNVFKEEIIHAKRGYSTSLREQDSMTMYEYLDPSIKYYFFPENPTFPLSKIMYNYLSTLYRMNNIYKKFQNSLGFEDTMQILMNLSNKEYKGGIPMMKYKDNMLIFDEFLHIHEVFNSVTGVHILLDELFDYAAEELYNEYQKNIEHPKTSYQDMLGIHIRESLDNNPLNVKWLFYCLNMLQEIHNNCIANKD